jgi:hypothetical protein
VRTSVYWTQNESIIDHVKIMPLTEESVDKMDHVPFIVNVWDR